MTETIAIARKWGNSIGVTIPEDAVKKEKIKPNDTLIISIRKAKPISELFGTLKTKKSTQQIKDEIRKGWE